MLQRNVASNQRLGGTGPFPKAGGDKYSQQEGLEHAVGQETANSANDGINIHRINIHRNKDAQSFWF